MVHLFRAERDQKPMHQIKSIIKSCRARDSDAVTMTFLGSAEHEKEGGCSGFQRNCRTPPSLPGGSTGRGVQQPC